MPDCEVTLTSLHAATHTCCHTHMATITVGNEHHRQREGAAVLDRCERAPASSEPSPVPVRDADDARILADAVAAGVQILVTGDNDLLDVAEESPIPIVSPRASLMLTRGGSLTGVWT